MRSCIGPHWPVAFLLTVLGACTDADDDSGAPDAGNNNNSLPMLCGDGIQSGSEECDQGAGNSDSLPDACRTDCTLPRCGDSVVDTGETCDDGQANSSAPDAECRPGCLQRRCGDGILDALSGEECDQGALNAQEPNSCRPTCLLPSCGDGVLDTSYAEVCDLGPQNSEDPDAQCRPDCTLQRCGDGIADPLAGEECDDGQLNADEPNKCRPTCLSPRCGDGIVDSYSEQCDQGSMNSNQADATCRLDCTPRRCGDSIVDPLAGETCDSSPLGQETACVDLYGFEYVGCYVCGYSCLSSQNCVRCPGGCGSYGPCWVQHPPTTSTTVGTPSEVIYGQIQAGAQVGALTAQLGYGDAQADPSSWQWFPATVNAACLNCWQTNSTEYMASLTIPSAGTFTYSFRFTNGCPGIGPFMYCGSNGTITVNP